MDKIKSYTQDIIFCKNYEFVPYTIRQYMYAYILYNGIRIIKYNVAGDHLKLFEYDI